MFPVSYHSSCLSYSQERYAVEVKRETGCFVHYMAITILSIVPARPCVVFAQSSNRRSLQRNMGGLDSPTVHTHRPYSLTSQFQLQRKWNDALVGSRYGCYCYLCRCYHFYFFAGAPASDLADNKPFSEIYEIFTAASAIRLSWHCFLQPPQTGDKHKRDELEKKKYNDDNKVDTAKRKTVWMVAPQRYSEIFSDHIAIRNVFKRNSFTFVSLHYSV